MQHEARPLLQAMPATALRLQVIRSLAKMTQSTPEEVEGLYGLKAVAPRPSMRAPGRVSRTAPVELERQAMRILVAQPALATELDADALQALARFSPDGGAMLEELVAQCAQVGAGGFAALAELLRQGGSDFDALIAEVAADTESEPELLRMDLRGAVRQSRLRLCNSDIAQLVAGGLRSEEEKQRYRDLMRLQMQLKQAEPAPRT